MEHPTDDRRTAALQRLREQRSVRAHVAVYVLVNALLIVVWLASGAGYFWPIWPIAGWGVAVAGHVYRAYFEAPLTEDDVDAELRRQEAKARNRSDRRGP